MTIQCCRWEQREVTVVFSSISTAEVNAHLSAWLNRVAFGNERLVVRRRGKPVAALVSMEDLHRLESLDAASTEAVDKYADATSLLCVTAVTIGELVYPAHKSGRL
ncbi:MAG: type II toxin-antitoxin system Phd/YefM family antitoxin [Caldilineaceae bacterium]|nr:type II toxin-antitoxin system Phd/YefM family antitoxin [Caldilineaceae bacterium]